MSSLSNTARSGNVLVLLDLYTSGFASSNASPSLPMLTSRTMHALYAISLLVYSLDSLLNWLHVYAVLQGFLTSFPLRLWFILLLVVASVSGSMLILLLVMLCVENAFVHRLDIAEHKTGLTVVWEAFVEWLQAFNNFRIAFLFMALHDAPITLANFFLLSPCRCANSQVLNWPLFFSVLSTSSSLLWRLVLLYFAYSRLLFPSRKASSALPSRNQSFRNHLEPSYNQTQEAKLDESWPIRCSNAVFYGDSPTKRGNARRGTIYLDGDSVERRSLGQCFGFWLSCVLFRGMDLVLAVVRRLLCLLSTVLLYSACLALGCTPCLHFYFCRKNSFSHRHKCARAFVRRCTFVFHYSIILLSLLLSLFLLLLNLVLLSSVHLIGPNNWPPEISRLCISIDPNRRLIRPLLLPERSLLSPLWPSPEQFLPPLSQCKPIWDLPQPQSLASKWAPGLSRMNPGPWQSRVPLGHGNVLAVSTHFVSNHSRAHSPEHWLFYDFALLHFGADNSTRTAKCQHQEFSGWFFTNRPNQLGFPYFLACSPTIHIRRAALIDCQALTRTRTAWRRRPL